MGTNASGTKKYSIIDYPDGSWGVITKDVKHADSIFPVEVLYDSKGYIITLKIVEDVLTHSESFTEAFLAHYGKKGMKWGVRNDSSRSGGKTLPASDDAIKTAAIRQQVKSSAFKSTSIRTAPLSNAELKTAVDRMNLEQQYSRLETASRPPVVKLVSSLLGSLGKQRANSVVNDAVTKQVGAALKK